jgi:hypothetical protein
MLIDPDFGVNLLGKLFHSAAFVEFGYTGNLFYTNCNQGLILGRQGSNLRPNSLKWTTSKFINTTCAG